MDKDYKIVTCPECGNKGELKVFSSYEDKNYIYEVDEVVADKTTTWAILKCPVCENLLLHEHIILDEGEPYVVKNDIVYPSKIKYFSNLPEIIQDTYQNLISNIYHDSQMSIMKMRKILNMICEDKKAKGSDLRVKLLDLYYKGIISKRVLILCNIIREFGNNINHEMKCVNINTFDLIELKELLEIILFYVYELRKKSNYLYKKYNIKLLNKKKDKEQQLFENWKKNYTKFSYTEFKTHWLLEVSDEFIVNLVNCEEIKKEIIIKFEKYINENKKLNSKLVKIYFKYFVEMNSMEQTQ